ncbi:MAG: TRAP transporter large permease subunit [Deltaproteobacteria bacterium]|nr:TRAP transporter large permease subunit [Deltaproteobacteria bacterium]
MATLKYVMPLGLIVFLVVGVIFLGIATPTEAAATGALGSFILSAAYGRLNWKTLKNALYGTARIAVMIYMILTGAMAFSQLLAISGATVGLAEFTTSLQVTPISIMIAIMIVILILGTFMEAAAIIMVALPLFLPIVKALGYDPVWFAVLFLLNLEMAATTPPFGMCLFVMKGVTSPDTKMRDIYTAGFPFLICDAFVMASIMALPALALWLPSRMG